MSQAKPRDPAEHPLNQSAREQADPSLCQLGLDQSRAGASFSDIASALEKSGAAPELIVDITTVVAKQRALDLFLVGESLSQVREYLEDSGLDAEDANYVARAVDRERRAAQSRIWQGRLGMRIYYCGAIVWIIGLVLICGNLTGLFRTFAYAGFITTAVGFAIQALGNMLVPALTKGDVQAILTEPNAPASRPRE